MPLELRSVAIRPLAADQAPKDGCNHSRGRAVITPWRTFSSAAEAAQALGMSRQHAARLARTRRDGWRYVDE